MPQITFEDKNDALTAIMKDGEQIGVITHRAGQVGYRIFGEHFAGNARSVEEAKKAVQRHFN